MARVLVRGCERRDRHADRGVERRLAIRQCGTEAVHDVARPRARAVGRGDRRPHEDVRAAVAVEVGARANRPSGLVARGRAVDLEAAGAQRGQVDVGVVRLPVDDVDRSGVCTPLGIRPVSAHHDVVIAVAVQVHVAGHGAPGSLRAARLVTRSGAVDAEAAGSEVEQIDIAGRVLAVHDIGRARVRPAVVVREVRADDHVRESVAVQVARLLHGVARGVVGGGAVDPEPR